MTRGFVFLTLRRYPVRAASTWIFLLWLMNTLCMKNQITVTLVQNVPAIHRTHAVVQQGSQRTLRDL